MDDFSIQVLVVDDSERWRSIFFAALQKRPELQVIGEASDGVEAVRIAAELQPNLILLDIGLPALNGIEAARQIRKLSPGSKILFVSENRSPEIAQEAIRTGAHGYVIKSEARRELLPAVEAVLQGKPFLSVGLANPGFRGSDAIKRRHEVAFYVDDTVLIDGYSRFIQSCLESGNVVIAIINESHREKLLAKLERADGVDIAAAIEQGRYFPCDVVDTLSRLIVNDMPDPVRCAGLIEDLISRASPPHQTRSDQLAVCGEIAPTLLSKGDSEGAIRLEHFWDMITRNYGIHTLCGYLFSAFPGGVRDPILQRICAEHSANKVV